MDHEENTVPAQDHSPADPEEALSPSVSRRAFLRTAGLLGAGIAIGGPAAAQAAWGNGGDQASQAGGMSGGQPSGQQGGGQSGQQ